MPKHRPRVLAVFNTICLYGMERSVIETFDLLRSDIEPVLLIPRSNRRYRTALFREIEAKQFEYRYFSDFWDWPRVGKPHSLIQLLSLLGSIVIANLNVLWCCLTAEFIYLPGWTSAVYSLLAAMVFRLTGKKVIYFFHDLMPEAPRKILLSSAIATDLVHYAAYSCNTVTKGNPYVSAKPNHVIPPAIEVRSGDMPLGSSGKRRFVFIGQVSLHKGIDLLIEAFREISKKHAEAELHIVGGCEEHFEKQFRSLLGGHRSIKYWGFLDAAHSVLVDAYAYVHPSPPSRFHESFGRGAVEAMACGVPVICFASGALQEIIQDGVNGFLCNAESARSMAEQMTRLLADPRLRDRLAEGARRVYSERYSNEVVKQEWLGLLGAKDMPGCVGLRRSVGSL